jgi:Protein of unknown function (DUF1552)
MSSSPVIKLGRRHFLLGAGGLALAIPYLPSLEKEARAGGETARSAARYFCICNDHGGGWDSNYFPQSPAWGKPVSEPYFLQGHTVRSAPLASSYAAGTDGKSGVSSTIRASTSAGVLTKGLVGKMNMLQGLDVPWYLAHNQGGALGNYAVNDASGCTTGCSTSDGYNVAQLGARPTIDQIMANSSGFYAKTPKAPTIPIAGPYNANQARSWSFSGAQNPSSSVVPMNNTDSSLPLFESIFTVSPGGGMKTRTPAIGRVLQNYNSLMTGNARLSAADKFRLGQHIDMLHTLEGSLGASTTCATTPPAPADNSQYGVYGTSPNFQLWGQLYMDVIAAAFICNATRVASMAFGDTSNFSPSWNATDQSDWHHLVAHLWYQDVQQGYLLESYQGFFEQVFLYLAAKLDGALDPDGNTVLDNSLLVWTQECCMETHEQYGVQTTTFGSASGTLNTGLYCDYRHQNFMPAQRTPGQNQPTAASSKIVNYVTWPGLLWEQWLATQLRAMQIPATDWQLWKDSKGAVQQGYGVPYMQMSQYGLSFAPHYIPDYAASWMGGPVTMSMSKYYSNAGSALPFLMG